MDERMRVVKKSFTREQLKNMSLDDIVALVGEAGPNAKFHGTAIVKKADGTIRYANDAVPGAYHETKEELALNGKGS